MPVSVDGRPRAGPGVRTQEWDQNLSESPWFSKELILISLLVRKKEPAHARGPSLSPPPSPTSSHSLKGMH